MRKKFLSVLLATCMVASLAACGSNSGTSDKTTAADTTGTATSEAGTEGNDGTEPTEASGQLIVGSTTELTGDWAPYWTNNGADYDIWKLTEGLSTVDRTEEGLFVYNEETVLKSHAATENEDGSKTFEFEIYDNLKYNDGTAITAKDYVASILFWSSSVIGEMQAQNTFGMYFNGYKDFATGATKEFAGVRLLDTYKFSVTVAAENLPYFYEESLVSSYPLSLSFWAGEGVDIKDDGNGAYFTDNFTVENCKDTITAARFAVDRVSSGPWQLVSYDEASKTATVEVNPNFAGDYQGQKPLIQTIVYKKVLEATEMDELKTGSVELLNGMATGDEINAGLDLVQEGTVAYTSYDRSGYGKLQFACDFGPTQFVEVRQAVAYLLDRNDFAKTFTGGFGNVVNGAYGTAQWMYLEAGDELEAEMNSYSYSLEDAVKVLEEGGWVYDENGNEYKEGIRYKKLDDGTLMPLIIEWASSENNSVSELLVTKLKENPDVAAAGMQINQTVMTFSELLNYLYRDATQGDKYGVPAYGMFNLASNYPAGYDYSNDYTDDPEKLEQGYNTNFIIDEKLADLAAACILTDPADKEGYVDKWVEFETYWNSLLPDLPLYTNIYHDFYNAKLQNYNINSQWDMTYALLYAYVTE